MAVVYFLFVTTLLPNTGNGAISVAVTIGRKTGELLESFEESSRRTVVQSSVQASTRMRTAGRHEVWLRFTLSIGCSCYHCGIYLLDRNFMKQKCAIEKSYGEVS